jgi:hypothetical protein
MAGHDEVDCSDTLPDPRKIVEAKAVWAIRAAAS